MNEQNTPRTDSPLSAAMSAKDFASWGLEGVAYIRPITVEGTVVWAICAADGTGIGVAPDREMAFSAALENELEALSVH